MLKATIPEHAVRTTETQDQVVVLDFSKLVPKPTVGERIAINNNLYVITNLQYVGDHSGPNYQQVGTVLRRIR